MARWTKYSRYCGLLRNLNSSLWAELEVYVAMMAWSRIGSSEPDSSISSLGGALESKKPSNARYSTLLESSVISSMILHCLLFLALLLLLPGCGRSEGGGPDTTVAVSLEPGPELDNREACCNPSGGGGPLVVTAVGIVAINMLRTLSVMRENRALLPLSIAT